MPGFTKRFLKPNPVGFFEFYWVLGFIWVFTFFFISVCSARWFTSNECV